MQEIKTKPGSKGAEEEEDQAGRDEPDCTMVFCICKQSTNPSTHVMLDVCTTREDVQNERTSRVSKELTVYQFLFQSLV